MTLVSIAVGGHSAVSAATNNTLNFQARLQSINGNVVPDGYYNIQFKLYNVSTSGSALWTETYYDSNGVTAGNDSRVKVINGYVSVNLGSQTAFPGTIDWDQDLFVTMNIGGTTQTVTPTYDGEMNPRLKLTGVPYAFKASQLAQYNTVTGFTSTLSLLQPTVGNQVFQIQDQAAAGTYNLCVQNSTSCGFASSTGSGSYIQNSTGLQSGANFNISGTGIAATALQTPSLDTATATELIIGGTNATSINLNQSISIAANKNLTYSAGSGTFDQSASTGAFSTSTGTNTLNGNTTIANGKTLNVNGNATFKPTTNSTTAFQIQNSSATNLFTADTSANRLSVNGNIDVGVNFGTRALSDSFETPTLNLWDGWFNADVSSANKYDGAQSLHITQSGSSSYAYSDIASNTTYNARYYVKTASNGSLGAGLTDFFDGNTGRGLNFYRTSTSRLCVISYGEGTYTCGGTSLPLNVWNRIDISVTTTGSSETGTIYLNGVQEATRTFTTNVSQSYSQISIGDLYNNTQDIYIDDVVVDSSAIGESAAVNISDGLNVGGWSYLGGRTLVGGASNNYSAFQVQDATGISLFNANTVDKLITVGGNIAVTGSTLNTSLALSNFASGGSIGTAAATVDSKTSFTINQTTAGQNLTVPSPTDPTAGRIVYISNIGSVSVNLLGSPLVNGSTATLVWNGTAWTFSGADAPSILNQNSTTQTANFKISGTGIANLLQAATFDAATAGALNIGGGNATQINMNASMIFSAGKGITLGAGSGNVDLSASSGIFSTTSGANTLNGDTSLASGKTLTVNGKALIKPATDTYGAFQIQNTTGTAVLNVNTNAVSMSVNTSVGSLNVNGIANPSAPGLSTVSSGGSLAAATYLYRLAAVGATGNYTVAVAASPTSVVTTGSASRNTLTWSAVNDATGYVVYRSINGGSSWFVNPIASNVTSIIDNGSTYVWTTSGSPRLDSNDTGGVVLQKDTALKLDGGTGSYQSGLAYRSAYNSALLYNYNSGGSINLVSDSFRVTDTTGYNNSLSIDGTGATTFQNRVNSSSAFKLQNASSAQLFNVDTSTSTITIGNATNNVTFSAGTFEPILNGTARHAKSLLLAPEYTNAVLDAGTGSANTGSMTSGLDLTNRMNYYNWTTTQASAQSYDIAVQYQLPSDFASWGTTPLSISTYSSTTTANTIKLETRDTAGTVVCNFVDVTPGSTTAWATNSTACTMSTGTYTAGGYITIRIRLTAPQNGNVKVGNITLNYLSKY